MVEAGLLVHAAEVLAWVTDAAARSMLAIETRFSLDHARVGVVGDADAASQRPVSAGGRVQWAVLLMPLLVGALMAPMVLTSRSYAVDWGNHLWLVWQQSLNISELGHPSYFVQSSFGAFYPWFAFNGGTLYAIAGALAVVIGEHPLAAYLGCYLVSFIVAYGGWLWLGHQVGLAGWRANVPAILFLTSSFYVTNVYGRGDYPEVAGTSAIPLVLAGAVYLLRAQRWRPLPLAAFVAAVVFLTGSHTITALWGVTFLAAAAVVLIVALQRSWRPRLRRVLSVAAVGVAAVAVNAWFLVPAVLYQSRILINDEYPGISQTFYTNTGQLFGILRDNHNPPWIAGDVEAQLPTIAIVWALVVAIVVWPRTAPLLRRAMLGLIALLALFVGLVLTPHFLSRLGPWQHIEFPFRLVTYASLAACALVMIGLLALDCAPPAIRRTAHAVLVLLAVFSVTLAIQQIWHAPSFLAKGRDQVFASATTPPPTWYYGPDYADRSQPIQPPALHSLIGGTPLVRRAGIELAASPYRTRYNYPIVVSRPGTVATNVAAGPYLVTVNGARPIGRTPAGTMIVQVGGRPGQRKVVSFTTAASRVRRLGVVLTLASIASLLVLLLIVAVHSQRLRRRLADEPSPPLIVLS